MKFLCTRICNSPNLIKGKLILSFDALLWQDANKIDKIRDLFLDRYNHKEPNINEEYFQPKDMSSLNAVSDDFLPCVLGAYDVSEQIITDYQFEPTFKIYKISNLVLLGYEILDTEFMSAYLHGVYPNHSSGILNNSIFLIPRKWHIFI